MIISPFLLIINIILYMHFMTTFDSKSYCIVILNFKILHSPLQLNLIALIKTDSLVYKVHLIMIVKFLLAHNGQYFLLSHFLQF